MLRAEIADRGGHDDDIRLREVAMHRVKHLLRGLYMDSVHAVRLIKRNRPGYERDLGSHGLRRLGECIPHFPSRMVGQVPYRVERLLGGAGSDQHV